MGDLNSRSRMLIIKRLEHAKSVAVSQIQAREIRIMELEEEIERMRQDIEAQKNVITEADANVKIQKEEMAKAEKEAK